MKKINPRDFLRDFFDLLSLVIFILVFYLEFFAGKLDLYSNPILDRTATFDHLYAVIAMFFFFSIVVIKSKKPFFTLCLTAFIFGMVNTLANFVVGNVFSISNSLPIISLLILFYGFKIPLTNFMKLVIYSICFVGLQLVLGIRFDGQLEVVADIWINAGWILVFILAYFIFSSKQIVKMIHEPITTS